MSPVGTTIQDSNHAQPTSGSIAHQNLNEKLMQHKSDAGLTGQQQKKSVPNVGIGGSNLSNSSIKGINRFANPIMSQGNIVSKPDATGNRYRLGQMSGGGDANEHVGAMSGDQQNMLQQKLRLDEDLNRIQPQRLSPYLSHTGGPSVVEDTFGGGQGKPIQQAMAAEIKVHTRKQQQQQSRQRSHDRT